MDYVFGNNGGLGLNCKPIDDLLTIGGGAQLTYDEVVYGVGEGSFNATGLIRPYFAQISLNDILNNVDSFDLSNLVSDSDTLLTIYVPSNSIVIAYVSGGYNSIGSSILYHGTQSNQHYVISAYTVDLSCISIYRVRNNTDLLVIDNSNYDKDFRLVLKNTTLINKEVYNNV